MHNEAATARPARHASTRRARSLPGSDPLMKATVRYDVDEGRPAYACSGPEFSDWMIRDRRGPKRND